MKILDGGCRVYSPEDGPVSTHGNWTARAVISQSTGAKRITQTVHRFGAGTSPGFVNPIAEEVLYVAAGEGSCRIGGFAHRFRAGSAIFVPPENVCQIENAGPQVLEVVSSCCPEDPGRRIVDHPEPRSSGEAPRLVVHEDEREGIRAGEDRMFRYLVHTDLGCREVTQFLGSIPPSRAPLHFHTYEECIFILDGHGILHLEGQPSASEFGPGSSIYLPEGVVHCLENPGPAPIRLLGVFYPSGSPSAAYEDD